MFVHHLTTVGLISFSYVNNMVRMGSLVMCVHDASDFLLEVRFTRWQLNVTPTSPSQQMFYSESFIVPEGRFKEHITNIHKNMNISLHK